MANFSDFYFDSSTGKNRIYVRQWSPEGEPRGIVQIEHFTVFSIGRLL